MEVMIKYSTEYSGPKLYWARKNASGQARFLIGSATVGTWYDWKIVRTGSGLTFWALLILVWVG